MAISSRLITLGRAHDILTQANWAAASIRTVVEGALAPHDPGNRIMVLGPDLLPAVRGQHCRLRWHSMSLRPTRLNTRLSRTKQERSTSPGRSLDQEAVRVLYLRWEERAARLVNRPTMPRLRFTPDPAQPRELKPAGKFEMEFAPTGLVCTIEAPLESMAAV